MSRYIKLFIFLSAIIYAQNKSSVDYLFPIPGSELIPVETQLIIRLNKNYIKQTGNAILKFVVFGEKSGAVEGDLVKSSDDRTFIFYPIHKLKPAELISVKILNGKNKEELLADYKFRISPKFNSLHKINGLYHSNSENQIKKGNHFNKTTDEGVNIINGISIPQNFPLLDIPLNDGAYDANIFVTDGDLALIYNNNGDPIWYRFMKTNLSNFNVQQNGYITINVGDEDIWNGPVSFDSTYTLLKKYKIPVGYTFDDHEFLLLDNGHYLIVVSDEQVFDLTQYGGNENTNVLGTHIVEMDAQGNPVLIWRCWDYYNIWDAIHENFAADYIDYCHINSIDIDLDSNIIISSRHLSEITKIDRLTGEIIWRLGGVNNQFEWINDEHEISYQHEVKVTTEGTYTLFDNGNYHQPQFSRALELDVDTTEMTVTKIWEFREIPDNYSRWMGNVQRLPNGNTLINWGVEELPKITEVTPSGDKVYEMNFKDKVKAYRVYKSRWKGIADVPYLITYSYTDGVTLLFNKFGDQNVSHYNIYGGYSPEPDQLIATSEVPYKYLNSFSRNGEYYLRTTAVDSAGQESGYSNEAIVILRITDPGENMIYNGDFSEGFNYWNLEDYNSEAGWEITPDGELHLMINSAGEQFRDVKLYYPHVPLVNDKTYIFEFDAYSDTDRIFQAIIEQEESPFINYSKIGFTQLTDTRTHYYHEFVMDQASDPDAVIAVYAGKIESDIYIDNISLKEMVATKVEYKNILPDEFQLSQNYPNPFNPSTTIQFHLPDRQAGISNSNLQMDLQSNNQPFIQSGEYELMVELVVYDALGREVTTLVNESKAPGRYEVEFSGDGGASSESRRLSSGVYFYRLLVSSSDKKINFNDVRKMIFIK